MTSYNQSWQVDLSLLAECRPTKNCQEFSAVSSPINKSHFWAEHAPVFLTVLVLSTVIFLVLLVGFLGGKCRDRWWRTGNYDAARDDYEAYVSGAGWILGEILLDAVNQHHGKRENEKIIDRYIDRKIDTGRWLRRQADR